VRTDALIDLLAADGTPRWSFAEILAFAAAGGVLAAGGAFLLSLGPRDDIALAARSVRFLFKFVVTATLAAGAVGATLRMGQPGAAAVRWRCVLAAAPALLLAAVVLELTALPANTWMGRLVGQNARTCLTFIPLLAVGPLVCLLLALRQGAPAAPGRTGAMAGLAASGIAATFYAAYCTDDSPLFVATWYPAATFMVAAAGYVAGERFLRW
jgi:hypothetical protein